MSDRASFEKGSHSSRHLLPVALLLLPFCGARAEEPPALAPAEASNAEPAAAPAATATHPGPEASSASAVKLPVDTARSINLYLGSAKELLPPEQWDTIVAAQPTDSAEEGDLPSLGRDEDVQVEGSRAAPKVPSGFGGLFWALRHPAQAWRIFAPAQ